MNASEDDDWVDLDDRTPRRKEIKTTSLDAPIDDYFGDHEAVLDEGGTDEEDVKSNETWSSAHASPPVPIKKL